MGLVVSILGRDELPYAQLREIWGRVVVGEGETALAAILAATRDESELLIPGELRAGTCVVHSPVAIELDALPTPDVCRPTRLPTSLFARVTFDDDTCPV